MDDIARREKIRWTHVPFKGSAESYNALLGKQVDIVSGTANWELVQAGRMRVLVTWGPERNRRSPEVPNLNEIYGIVSNSPWGIAGPKGMDPRVVKLLHDAFRKALDDPQFLQVLERVGMEPFYMSGEDYLKWARQAAVDEKAAVERLGLAGNK